MHTRRHTLAGSAAVAGLLALTGLVPRSAFAASDRTAFQAKQVTDATRALGARAPVESQHVTLEGPDIAENGAVVPFTLGTTLSGVSQLALLVENNPAALVAVFHLTDAVDARFTLRAKMDQSSNVYAVAIMPDGTAFYAKREVQVTLGGCGG